MRRAGCIAVSTHAVTAKAKVGGRGGDHLDPRRGGFRRRAVRPAGGSDVGRAPARPGNRTSAGPFRYRRATIRAAMQVGPSCQARRPRGVAARASARPLPPGRNGGRRTTPFPAHGDLRRSSRAGGCRHALAHAHGHAHATAVLRTAAGRTEGSADGDGTIAWLAIRPNPSSVWQAQTLNRRSVRRRPAGPAHRAGPPATARSPARR